MQFCNFELKGDEIVKWYMYGQVGLNFISAKRMEWLVVPIAPTSVEAGLFPDGPHRALL